jgi:CxxC-x17-CxxC domain-containing protein
MNEGKIFLVNVSKVRIGEDNSALLGGMIITKIQLAAMERVRIPEDERKDFYLYVDEFQNFVTDAFASILSEARKYRLNLTVAHQYTAQLVSDKSTAVRDAVFGNVGTMIVFRVGSDDAEFLEKEFEPEFTPSDIVNLPNYKIYLKLMIDGITSRPFSAKTLPPMVKSGNKEIEDAVINSSRELYCRSKEDVEREINEWSGMSLGSDTDGLGMATGIAGKFPVICSICKQERTVPFKPEPGRPVYCKDCIAKIKSGELKPIKGSIKQINQDQDKFFKPLADLGIEFTVKAPTGTKETRANEDRYPERQDNHTENKIIHKKKPVPNLGLKEALKKAFSIPKTPAPAPAVQRPEPEPVSLDVLKNKIKDIAPQKDKSASTEDKDKLKNLIAGVTPSAEKQGTEPPLTAGNIKEVPEEVLRKILDE